MTLPLNQIILNDALAEMRTYPDKCIDAIITDPPWPDVALKLPGCENFAEVWPTHLQEMARITDRLIIIIGCDSDPRFLKDVPTSLPFVRLCNLKLIPPRYKGPILFDSEVAYIFGHNRLPGYGQRVLPGECFSASKGFHDPLSGDHPCPRRWEHCTWLVKNFTRKGQTVLDPYCGTGTIPGAASFLGRNFIGIEFHKPFFDIAVARIAGTPVINQTELLEV